MVTLLPSLTLFFPFFNDAGTVNDTIADAYRIGKQIAKKIEVIAIHGGASSDKTMTAILEAKRAHPTLKVLDYTDNTEGYAVIRHGWEAATLEWVFYTDGDRQYSLDDLPALVVKQKDSGADVVNGYKTGRGDSLIRRIVGSLYAFASVTILGSPVHDPHCDFRLIRRSFLAEFSPRTRGARILDELLAFLSSRGAVFAEVAVSHYPRQYGKSNYSLIRLAYESASGIMSVLFRKP